MRHIECFNKSKGTDRKYYKIKQLMYFKVNGDEVVQNYVRFNRLYFQTPNFDFM